jgi:hypothetical protein
MPPVRRAAQWIQPTGIKQGAPIVEKLETLLVDGRQVREDSDPGL